MAAAAIELQKAVFAALSGDAGLVAALGSGRIFDHAPANVPFPYVTFGRASAYDWATATEDGTEHLFTVHVWSRAKGRLEAATIMAAVRKRLHDAALALSGHVLVNLREESQEMRFEDDHGVHHGMARFRAVTEPAG